MSIQEKNHIKTNDFKQLLKASFKSEDTDTPKYHHHPVYLLGNRGGMDVLLYRPRS